MVEIKIIFNVEDFWSSDKTIAARKLLYELEMPLYPLYCLVTAAVGLDSRGINWTPSKTEIMEAFKMENLLHPHYNTILTAFNYLRSGVIMQLGHLKETIVKENLILCYQQQTTRQFIIHCYKQNSLSILT